MNRPVNERSLRVLEYDKIVGMLKELTSFEPGAELAAMLSPSAEPQQVEAELDDTAEAVHFLEQHDGAPLVGAKDVRIPLGRAAREGTLTGEELLDVAQTISVMARCKTMLLSADARQKWPRLAALTARLETFSELEKSIRRCIGEDGVVLDRASDTLQRLRTQIRTWQGRSRERLDQIVRAAASRNVLQEAIVTLRNERYVIPVKVEHKTAVPGIVHDTSSSGATLFVEPMAVVELNNKIKEAQVEEEREVQRILRELSRRVGAQGKALADGVDVLARLDLIFAKARLARRMDGVRPQMNEDGWLHIKGSRHPLLTGNVVPIDVWLGKDNHVLVITGPNTGGKTVTLKTIGLFALMAQSGLFVPAREAQLAVFRGVFADIGDEQSIEQSLSTFSSHMANIVDILAAADGQSLVLLDELGAGTDPAEGAALAMAILQHLADNGVRTVATTHYSELKSFVHGRLGMQNASVEFDPKTLAPTYRLIMGTPGRSNAIEIATRLGLPQSIIDNARGTFAKADDVRVEDLLRDLEETRRAAQAEREAATRLRQEAEVLRRKLEKTEARLAAQRSELQEQVRVEMRQMLVESRREVESIIAALRRRQDEVGVQQAREAHKLLRRRLDSVQRAVPDAGQRQKERKSPKGPFIPRAGDAVFVPALRQDGVVQTAPDGDGNVAVQVGSMRIVVAAKDLQPATDSVGVSSMKVSRRQPSAATAVKRADISPEISLRGMLVDEALYVLEKYLDDALLAGLERVLVVHGKGTGALRRAVHDYVQHHPHVTNWYIAEQSAGGYGATVVEL